MSLSAQPAARGSFGKRGAEPPRPRRGRSSEVSSASPASPDAAEVFDPDTFAIRKTTAEGSVVWAYVKACAVAFASALAITVLFGGSHNPMAGNSLFQNLVGIIVAPTLGGVMAVPAFILAQIVSLLGIRRGGRDGRRSAGLGLDRAGAVRRQDAGRDAHAFLIGGCIGGFAFWRAQGYPGVTSKTAGILDQVYDRAR